MLAEAHIRGRCLADRELSRNAAKEFAPAVTGHW
jgi:hypothetical protein